MQNNNNTIRENKNVNTVITTIIIIINNIYYSIQNSTEPTGMQCLFSQVNPYNMKISVLSLL